MSTFRHLTAAIAVACLAACGSTVQVRSSAQAGPAGTELGGPAQAGRSDSEHGAGPQPAAPGAVDGPPATGASATDPPSSPAATAPRTLPSGAARVTSPISIGFLLPNADQSETAAKFGASNNNTVGPRGMTMAMVAYLNKHGGIAGRRIRPVYATINATSSSFDAQFQAACSTFLEDNRVVAVLSQIAYSPVLAGCLRSAGVPLVLGQFSTTDAVDFAKGLVYAPLGLSDDDRYRFLLEQHAASGFLSKSNRIGILRGSCANDDRAYERTVAPTLKRLGLQPVSEYKVRCVSGFGDTGGAVGDLQAAVLRFSSDRVDRVVPISNDEANGVYLFSVQAENQGYRPGYAVTSNFAASVARPNMSAAQVRNVQGVGWIPSLDDEQRHPLTSEENHCLSALAAEGQRAVTATDRYFAYAVCGAFDLYQAALVATQGQSSASTVARAIAALGTSLRLPGVLDGASRFEDGRPFGPADAKRFTYQASCGCFRYVGRGIHTP